MQVISLECVNMNYIFVNCHLKEVLCFIDDVVTCYFWFLVAVPAAAAPDNQDSLCELCILCASKVATA